MSPAPTPVPPVRLAQAGSTTTEHVKRSAASMPRLTGPRNRRGSRSSTQPHSLPPPSPRAPTHPPECCDGAGISPTQRVPVLRPSAPRACVIVACGQPKRMSTGARQRPLGSAPLAPSPPPCRRRPPTSGRGHPRPPPGPPP
eukprot:2734662-Pleurochrysis_carterae.AAC.1